MKKILLASLMCYMFGFASASTSTSTSTSTIEFINEDNKFYDKVSFPQDGIWKTVATGQHYTFNFNAGTISILTEKTGVLRQDGIEWVDGESSITLSVGDSSQSHYSVEVKNDDGTRFCNTNFEFYGYENLVQEGDCTVNQHREGDKFIGVSIKTPEIKKNVVIKLLKNKEICPVI